MTAPPANPLGARLTAAREAKGMSVQKAADQLHLDLIVIESLESGDYSRIGPPVYVKGHLRRYSTLIGLPLSEVLEAYDPRSAPPPAAANAPTNLRVTTALDLRRQSRRFGLVACAVVILLIGAGVYHWHPWPVHAAVQPGSVGGAGVVGDQIGAAPGEVGQAAAGETAAERSASQDETATRGPTAAATRGPSAAATRGPTAAAASSAGSDGPSATGLGRARLRLSFSADSWVDVHDAAGHRLYAGNGHANSVRTITGDAPMMVYLGFASGVQLQVNNHVVAIGPQFLAGDVARFEAGADGVLRRDTRSATAAKPHPRG